MSRGGSIYQRGSDGRWVGKYVPPKNPLTGKYVIGIESYRVGRSYTRPLGTEAVAKPDSESCPEMSAASSAPSETVAPKAMPPSA